MKLESDLQDEIKAILTEQREMDEEYQIRLEEEEEEAERRCQQAEIEEEGKKVSRAEVEELEEKVESMSQQLEDCKSRERELELFLDEKTKQFQEASKAVKFSKSFYSFILDIFLSSTNLENNV